MSETAVAPPPAAAARGRGPGLAFWLVAGAVAAFGLFLLALAFPPDLRGGDTGAHALSRSPVGYAGVIRLLRATGSPVRIGFTAAPPTGAPADALLVVTPTLATSADDVRKLARGRRTLVVAPKWVTTPDPRQPSRVLKVGEAPTATTLAAAAALLGKPLSLTETGRAAPVLSPVTDEVETGAPLPAGPIDHLRTLSGPGFAAVFTDARGRAVVARAADAPLYVLSDPDLLDNHGIADLRTARAGVGVLAALAGGRSIVWDVTLNGLGVQPRAKSPLRVLFTPPLLPATLCLFAAAALTGFAARGRFGAVEDAGRAYGFGKRALADSAASLFALAGREPALAPRYAELAREAAAAATGLPPGASRADSDAALDRVGLARGAGRWSAVAAAAQGVTTLKGLMIAARRAYDWRRGMTGGCG